MSLPLLKRDVKLAIRNHHVKWNPVKVESIEVLRSIYDEQQGTGTMYIEITVKKKRK
jgi:hypothetical protein